MDPQSDECLLALQRLWLHQETAEDNASEISQIEDVVGLGRRGEEIPHGFLVDLEGCGDQHGAQGVVLWVEILSLKGKRRGFMNTGNDVGVLAVWLWVLVMCYRWNLSSYYGFLHMYVGYKESM